MTENEAIEELKCYVSQSGTSHPEEIEMSIKALEDVQQYRTIGTVEECKEAVEKLKHYKDLEKQGHLIKGPCKKGDTVYAIIYDYEKEQYVISETMIIEIIENCNGWFFVPLLSRPAFRPKDLGKTVFLTREKAEEKLKEMRGVENAE